MSELISTITGLAVKGGIAVLLANEVRGFILAAPVLYGMYAAGGTAMAIWLGFCSLAGIMISITPLFVAKRLNLLPIRKRA